MPHKRLVVEEWEPIPLEDASGLSFAQATQLERAAAEVGARNLFRWSRLAVSPQNWLGIVRGQDVELDIVPKGWKALSELEKRALQSNLIVLAAQSLGLKIYVTGLAEVAPEVLITDHLYSQFLETAKRALRQRVLRQYKTMSEAGIKLRGALAFPEQILVRTMAPSYFATRYTELSQDNPYNRVLAAAATVVSQSFREDLRLGALIVLAALKSKPAFDALLDDRSRARRMQLPDTHLAALTLAELILESRAAAFFVGDVTLGAQLIASDRLWEQGVTSIAMRAAVTKLSAQPRGNFAFRRLSGGGRAYELELIPDMLGTNGDIVVVDAKWKLLDPVTPQAATDDLHQALAYARHYAAKRIVLLYPSFQSSASSSGPFARLTTTAAPTVEVSLWLLPMLDTPGQMFEAISSALKAA